jgi:DNA modification methylase
MTIIAQEIGERYAAYHSDCMEVLPDLASASVGFSVYSPPFPQTYEYSNDPRDMSNCVNYEEGIEQYRFVVREVFRLLKPGRLTAVHCMDLKHGTYYQRDFPGDIVRVHEAEGFSYLCRVTIWKDPWLIARRTRTRGLMHKSIVQDSSICRVAGADYVLVFRKGGKNTEPIGHRFGLKKYAGEKQPPHDLVERFRNYEGDQRKNLLSHWIWRRYASPVWDDIRTGRLLPFQDSKETDEESHICPLQLDVIDRCLALWSNPEDVILTPFMGVGSEMAGALNNGRRALGCELKETYFRQALANIKAALKNPDTGDGPTLYDNLPSDSAPEDSQDEWPDMDGDEQTPAESPEQEALRRLAAHHEVPAEGRRAELDAEIAPVAEASEPPAPKKRRRKAEKATQSEPEPQQKPTPSCHVCGTCAASVTLLETTEGHVCANCSGCKDLGLTILTGEGWSASGRFFLLSNGDVLVRANANGFGDWHDNKPAQGLRTCDGDWHKDGKRRQPQQWRVESEATKKAGKLVQLVEVFDLADGGLAILLTPAKADSEDEVPARKPKSGSLFGDMDESPTMHSEGA